MAIVINGSGTVTGISVGGLPDGIVDAGTLATNSVDSAELIDGAVDNSHMATKPVEATSVVNTEGQDWDGVTYTDPDAVGTNPTAKVYPDGTVVGSTGNGDYTKYPNGELVCTRTIQSSSSSDITWTFPMQFNAVPTFYGTSVGDENRVVTIATAIPDGNSLEFRAWVLSSDPVSRSSTSCRLQTRGKWT